MSIKYLLIKSIVVLVLIIFKPSFIEAKNINGTNNSGEKDSLMKIDEFKKKILACDWDALDLIDELGDSVLPSLEKLFGTVDGEKQEIVVHGIALLKASEKTVELLVKALDSQNSEVRVISLQNLNSAKSQAKFNRATFDSLIKELKSNYPEVRAAAGRFLAQADYGKALKPVADALSKEKESETREELILASARLGYKKSVGEILEDLKSNDPTMIYNTIERLVFVNNKKLSNHLKPLLDDKRVGNKITMHGDAGPGKKTIYRTSETRICDAAVNLISSLFDRPFKFETGIERIYSNKPYTDDEISQVKSYLSNVK